MKPAKRQASKFLNFAVLGATFITIVGPAGAAYATNQTHVERAGYHSPLGQSYADYLIGQYAITQGDIHSSAIGFEKASLAEPENLSLRDQAFLMALLDGNMDAVVRLNPNDNAQSSTAMTMSALSHAVLALKSGKTAQAATYIEKLLVLNPNDRAGNLLRPVILAKRGDWRLALDDEQLGLNEIEKDDPLLAFFLKLQKAKLLEIHGQDKEAEAIYKFLVDQSPAAKVFFGIDYGHFLERRGRKEEANNLYQELAEKGDAYARAEHERLSAKNYIKPNKPKWAELYANALFIPASIALNQDDSEMALAYLQLSFSIEATPDKRLVNLGQAFLKLKDNEAAEKAWLLIPETSPSYLEARLNYIHSLKSRDEIDEANSEINRLYSAYPQQLDLMIERADSLRAVGKSSEALSVISKRIEVYGEQDFTWQTYFYEAMIFDELDQWDNAQVAIEKAMVLNASRAEILNFYGYGLISHGIDVKKGMDYVRQALKMSPRSGAIIDSLGWGYFKLGDATQALMFIEQAVQLQPADPEINEHLGDVYMAVGRKIEAEYAWQRVLSLKPSDKISQSVKAKLSLVESKDIKAK